MEADEGVPSANVQTILKVKATLEAAGVIFIDANGHGPGVCLKR